MTASENRHGLALNARWALKLQVVEPLLKIWVISEHLVPWEISEQGRLYVVAEKFDPIVIGERNSKRSCQVSFRLAIR
jgi:hypothetical protein